MREIYFRPFEKIVKVVVLIVMDTIASEISKIVDNIWKGKLNLVEAKHAIEALGNGFCESGHVFKNISLSCLELMNDGIEELAKIPCDFCGKCVDFHLELDVRENSLPCGVPSVF